MKLEELDLKSLAETLYQPAPRARKKKLNKEKEEKKKKELLNEFLYCPDVNCPYLTTVKFNLKVNIWLLILISDIINKYV